MLLSIFVDKMVGLFRRSKKKKDADKGFGSTSEEDSASEDSKPKRRLYKSRKEKNGIKSKDSSDSNSVTHEKSEALKNERNKCETDGVQTQDIIKTEAENKQEEKGKRLSDIGKRVTFDEESLISASDFSDLEDELEFESSVEEESLFDDDVLSAFQDGQISLHEFLTSPQLSRPTDRIKEVGDLVDSDDDLEQPLSNETMEKLAVELFSDNAQMILQKGQDEEMDRSTPTFERTETNGGATTQLRSFESTDTLVADFANDELNSRQENVALTHQEDTDKSISLHEIESEPLSEILERYKDSPLPNLENDNASFSSRGTTPSIPSTLPSPRDSTILSALQSPRDSSIPSALQSPRDSFIPIGKEPIPNLKSAVQSLKGSFVPIGRPTTDRSPVGRSPEIIKSQTSSPSFDFAAFTSSPRVLTPNRETTESPRSSLTPSGPQRKIVKSLYDAPNEDCPESPNLESWDNRLDLRPRAGHLSMASATSNNSHSQREFAIIDDKLVSGLGNHTFLVENEPEAEFILRGSTPKPDEKVDPWLSYLPNLRRSSGSSLERSPARSTSAASDTSAYASEDPTGYDSSDESVRCSTSTEYATSTGRASRTSEEERFIRFSNLEIDFYIPPPPPVDEEVVASQVNLTQDAIPLNMEWDYELPDSPTLTPSSSVVYVGNHKELAYPDDLDPIAESLLSLLPIPDESFQSVVGMAMGEIVTEIVATRQKLFKMNKLLELQQRAITEQRQIIHKQAKEITELKRIAGAFSSAASSPLVNRKKDFKSYPASGRRSKELIDLECTLDKLLYQCHTLQQTSQSDTESPSGTPRNSGVTTSGISSAPDSFVKREVKVSGGAKVPVTQVKTLIHKKVSVGTTNSVKVLPAHDVVYKVCTQTSESVQDAQKVD